MDNWWKKVSNHLGGIYPYYSIDKPSVLSLDIRNVLENDDSSLHKRRSLDVVSLVEKVTIPYLLGDRTMIKGIQKAPWFHKYEEEGVWSPAPLPSHNTLLPDRNSYVDRIHSALLDEMIVYIGKSSTVGILLSGGMDSRVAAGLIRELQIKGIFTGNVVALTWGLKDSRDVIYSENIAKKFGWDHQWFPIDAEVLGRNIRLCGENGAEVSPFHYHAMYDVSQIKTIDVVIAASYGDSVGRAEFSGSHLTKLKSIYPKNWDPFNLIQRVARKSSVSEILNEVAVDLDEKNKNRRFEIQQQKHYMRRMLQHCMQSISTKIPIYQIFTCPKVFSLMWALDPNTRDNSWYTMLLNKLPGNLLEIPWARTGRLYDVESDVMDQHQKSYHQYGMWLRNELKSSVVERIERGTLQKLNIFNETSLSGLVRSWGRQKGTKLSRLDHTVSWLASLVDFIEHYDVILEDEYSTGIFTKIDDTAGMVKSKLYVEYLNRVRN